MELRHYQRDALDALYRFFQDKDGNPLIVMPTGTGKSVVIAGFLREALNTWPDTRVLIITHVKELIFQNYAALIRAWPEAPAGVYSAGLNRRDINAPILFAGIQSIHKKAYNVQRCDLVLIDEAHLLGKSDTGMYRQFLRQLRDINPDLRVVGFTATPYRADQGMLTEGEDRLFTDIAFDLPMLKMIEQGYLCQLIPKATETQLDVSQVGTRGGEFIASELEAAVDVEPVTLAAVDEIVRMGETRGSWLVFCSGVKHAMHVRDAITKWGISCACITGETPPTERDRLLREFQAGRLRALTNMNVLTTGFDAPGTDLIAMMRPTKSIGLYVQMLGRGCRTASGKEDCLVLDFAGNTKRHGPVDEAAKRVKKKGKGDGEFPAKNCPECKTIMHANTRFCPTCGHEFPPPAVGDLDIARSAATTAVLSTQIKPEWITVTGVSYSVHAKPDKPPSLCVEYQAGMARHREWICFQHSGYPREKAVQWWMLRAPSMAVPPTIADAMLKVDDLPRPIAISVKAVGKYTEILGVRFA